MNEGVLYKVDVLDFVWTLITLFIITAVAYFIKFKNRNKIEYKYFIAGYWAKMGGGIAFALIYTYYYNQIGDTFFYFWSAQVISDALVSDPIIGMKILFQSVNVDDPDTHYYTQQFFSYVRGNDTFLVLKITAVLLLLGPKSYFSATLFFSFFSFLGIWKFFIVLASKYPALLKQMAIATLFIPSVFFWGSGILKDSIVMGALGFLLYSIFNMVEKKNFKIKTLIIFAISFYVIFTIKAYIIVSFIPASALWIVLTYKNHIKNKVLKFVVAPFIIILALGGAFATFYYLGNSSGQYSLDNFLNTSSVLQSNHYSALSDNETASGTRSGYTLGEFEPTLLGVLSKFPAAVNVTLFRPYLWEVKSPVMVFSALESIYFLLFVIINFFRIGLTNIFRSTIQDPFILMSLLFAILFAFAVGFTSYNFGALVRYKIPCIPFFVSALYIMKYKGALYREKIKKLK